jgi:hypothetical protein
MIKPKKARNDSDPLPPGQMLFPGIDPFFERRLTGFFIFSLFLLILFGIFLFNIRISEGGDDSSYLLEAMKFSKGESFPFFHGTFYIMMIGWIIRFTGFHLIFFKILSLFFLIGHQIFFFLTFRRKISPFLLSMVLFIFSINSGILYFGSQTYTEAFYLLLQSVFFYLLINKLIDKPENFIHLATSWKTYAGLGLVLFLLSTTRNIGIVALISVIMYLVIEKKFRKALYTFAGFMLFKVPYLIYKRFYWNIHETDLHGQMTILMQKNPYNSSLGKENLGGMVERFFDNANIYLSRIFLQEIGLKGRSSAENNIVLTILIISLFIAGLYLAYRLNKKYLRPLFLYLLIAVGTSFISLNQLWSQSRLIIIFIPLLILCLSWTIAELGKEKGRFITGPLVVLLLVLISFTNLVHTIGKARTNAAILKRNLTGDKYYGYTPDMKNYLKISEWASKHVPESVKIGARKASMSFLCGNGREFYPIYKVPYIATGELLDSAARKSASVYFINDREIRNKPLPVLIPLKMHLYALIAMQNEIYSVYTFNSSQQADSIIQPLNISAIEGVGTFKSSLSVELSESKTSVRPDMLLNELKTHNVHYLIAASLRVNENDKSSLKINTIKRYLIAISSKYPGAFTMVKQIGANNDEPAWLFKINYKQCERLGWHFTR